MELCFAIIMTKRETKITEVLRGIVSRVTYHNPENGWSVLRVQSYESLGELVTVTVYQTKVHAGATMEFYGAWTAHPQYGRQFKADKAVEKKPATAAALEKYLGSGLIKGVGPKTAKRIVHHFKEDTLRVFEEETDKLLLVPGIAEKKLEGIRKAWFEHRMVRDVMMFLQGHGISTLFAVRIFKKYGERSITLVEENPYRLANDFYGIGFFSADKVALSIGLEKDSDKRIIAGVQHVLSASREQGHCYLTYQQILHEVEQLLDLHLSPLLENILIQMEGEYQLMMRLLATADVDERCYYSKSLYFEELIVAKGVAGANHQLDYDRDHIERWFQQYKNRNQIGLSNEQEEAVKAIVQQSFSVLTGGPGCGKTTATLAIVDLLQFLKRKVMLAAPTGRAAQRMGEVIGREAKTIHRLLGWQGGTFQHNEEAPLDCDFLIVDECSMLDISLSAALFKAIPAGCQVLFIGDSDQLPSVGAGNVLRDIIDSDFIPCFQLTKIFRQAEESKIIQYAHQMNKGIIPKIESPFKKPELWQLGDDCMFLDSEEASQEQLHFVAKVKKQFNWRPEELQQTEARSKEFFEFRTEEQIKSSYEQDFIIPDKFQHVDLQRLAATEGGVEQLKAVMRKVHPWSSLHYGLAGVDCVRRLYQEWIPKYLGNDCEIQVLSPMIRGSLGTANLNSVIQETVNPAVKGKAILQVGERVFREGDRVIHRRNNYDLGVFNGDIGKIHSIDTEQLCCTVTFSPAERQVEYQRDDMMELDLAYAITIHKSQGSEFQAVIIPVFTQHFTMLYRNLLYTGLTRGRKLAVLVGSRKALAMAVGREDSRSRQTALAELIRGDVG